MTYALFMRDQRQYFGLLKTDISNFINDFNKRYKKFPWDKVITIDKYVDKNQVIKINNHDYTVKSYIDDVKKIRTNLKNKLKKSYYNYILEAYIKEAKNYNTPKQCYDNYKKELKIIFKQMKLDLIFCLDGLRSVNTVLATKQKLNKIAKESVFQDDELKQYFVESVLVNEKDIYYNKAKFDSGEINLCFIIGLSGSGKSTMANALGKEYRIETVSLDDIFKVKDHFKMTELKKYGDLIYSFFSGSGKCYYLGKEDIKNIPSTEYEDKLLPEFINYSIKYASAHKANKYILEGVQIMGRSTSHPYPFFNPSYFDKYAVYIKGTSMIVSKIRAAKRDSKEKKKSTFGIIREFLTANWKWYFIDEKDLNIFREYFKDKIKQDSKKETKKSFIF